MALISSIGTRSGRPSKSRSRTVAARPSRTTEKSAEVPPMSKVIRSATPSVSPQRKGRHHPSRRAREEHRGRVPPRRARGGGAAVAAHVAQRRRDSGRRQIGLQGLRVLSDRRTHVGRGRGGVGPRVLLDLGVDVARAVHRTIGKPLPERGREPPLVHRVGPGEEQGHRERFGVERRDRVEHPRAVSVSSSGVTTCPNASTRSATSTTRERGTSGSGFAAPRS